jgi:predicted nucleotidyltransferase
MVQIKPEEMELIKKLAAVAIPNATIIAFGSRVYGQVRKHSDLDLAVKNADLDAIQEFRDYISVAPLPFMTDVVVYERIPDWLRAIIDEKGEAI